MAGAAVGNMVAMVLALFGLVSVVKARRRRRKPQADPVADQRFADRMEMERRMASYLASRDTREDQPVEIIRQNEGASDERR